jgi:hypothetical protein
MILKTGNRISDKDHAQLLTTAGVWLDQTLAARRTDHKLSQVDAELSRRVGTAVDGSLLSIAARSAPAAIETPPARCCLRMWDGVDRADFPREMFDAPPGQCGVVIDTSHGSCLRRRVARYFGHIRARREH